jgi:hypothetical protein
MHEAIEEGFMVFAAGRQDGVGSVREIHSDRAELVVYIENAGDFTVPLAAVDQVIAEKVMLRPDRLEPRLRAAIEHAHDAEEPDCMSGAPYHGPDQEPSNEDDA